MMLSSKEIGNSIVIRLPHYENDISAVGCEIGNSPHHLQLITKK